MIAAVSKTGKSFLLGSTMAGIRPLGLIFARTGDEVEKENAKSASSEGRRASLGGKIGAYLDEPRLLLSVLADVNSVSVVGETGIGGFELFEEDGHLCEKREGEKWRRGRRWGERSGL